MSKTPRLPPSWRGTKVPIPWYGWWATLREIRAGAFPNVATLVECLRGDQPVPVQVRHFLADWLDGKVTRPAGQQPPNPIDQSLADSYLLTSLKFEQDRIGATPKSQRKTRGTPTELAEGLLAKEMGLTRNTIKKYVKEARRRKRRKG